MTGQLPPEDFKKVENRWKSDVDLKLDRLVRFADTYEDYLRMCLEREITRKKLRDAFIEKSLIGAGWAILAFIGFAVKDYVVAQLKGR